jgi:hypothetical protein
MTIIALRAGILASDSGVFRNDIHVGYMEKVFSIRYPTGAVAGYATGAGSVSIIEAFVEHCRCKIYELSPNTIGTVPPYPDMSESTGILIGGHKGNGIWIAEKGGFFRAPHNEYYAWGSGSQFAFGALHQGATAQEAVAAAIAFDPWCGGEIKTYDVSQFLEGTDNANF